MAGPIDPDSVFATCEGLEITQAPDGYVIYNAAAEKVHYLNQSAGVVYELCDGTTSALAIGEFLKTAYELDAAPLDLVRDCLISLLEQGLVRSCPKSSAAR